MTREKPSDAEMAEAFREALERLIDANVEFDVAQMQGRDLTVPHDNREQAEQYARWLLEEEYPRAPKDEP